MVAASSVRAGFTGPEVPAAPRTESPRVVVIGTGFAGLCMGIRLKRAGIESFTIYEKAGSIGGTWRDNNYPGAACDVQSQLYSFSFEKNPRWSRMFAKQAEILGTGFEASESAAPFPITGRNGVSLADQWEPGAEAYLGTSVAGFPNFFLIVGPNSGLGHSSMVFMIESQVEHIMQALAVLRKAAAKSIEVRRDVQRTYNEGLHARLQRTVWASGCTSWYRTRSGKNTTLWPGFTFTFRRLTRRAPDAAYVVAAQLVVPGASNGKNSVGALARPAPPLVSHAET